MIELAVAWLVAGAPQIAPADAALATIAEAGAPVHITIDAELSSKTSRIGDIFPITLAQSLNDAAGNNILPAGVVGVGEVVHAAKAGMGGRPGELIITARYLQCGAARVKLGHLHLIATGHDNNKLVSAVNAGAAGSSVLVPVAGVGSLLAFMISGGQVVVPRGTPAEARVIATMALTATDRAACAPAADKQGEKQ